MGNNTCVPTKSLFLRRKRIQEEANKHREGGLQRHSQKLSPKQKDLKTDAPTLIHLPFDEKESKHKQ